MSLSRRDALRAVAGLGLSLGLSGCLSQVPEETGTVARAYDRTTGPYDRGPRQGRADPLTVDNPLVVDDADLEYLPEKNAVRFPSLMNQSGVVAYDTIPFGRWAQLKCAETGVDTVWNVVAGRLDGDPKEIGRGATSSFPGMVVELSHTTSVDDAGEVVSAPPVSFDELLDITPNSVTVTVALDGQKATHTVPVQVIGTVRPAEEEFELVADADSGVVVDEGNTTVTETATDGTAE